MTKDNPKQSGYSGRAGSQKAEPASAGGDAKKPPPKEKDSSKSKTETKDVKKDDKGKKDEVKGKEEPKGKTKEGSPTPKPKRVLEPESEPEDAPPKKTAEEIAQEEAEYRAMLRKQKFRRKWPEVTKVAFKTKPWSPPAPPQRMPPVLVDIPELKLRKWVPPFARRRKPRPRLPRILPERLPMYESSTLRKVWHNFTQVEPNKMMLQGSTACNSKKYSSTSGGAQTACIAVVCKALLEEKTPEQLVRSDVNDVIDSGDRFYKECMHALKCYKGKPQLQLNQLLTSFFFHDTRYTFKLTEGDKGILAKHPDNLTADPDLLSLMEKVSGTEYAMILTVGCERHFLLWGHPPREGGQIKTVCYILEPHMLDEDGRPDKLCGAGAFLRYPGVSSFVMDFLASYGNLNEATRTIPRPPISMTHIEIVQVEHLTREPRYELDLKTLKVHCDIEWESIHRNVLIEEKKKLGKHPLASLSAISIATSRSKSKKKMTDFYQRLPKEDPPPQPPVPPERPPPPPTLEQIMQMRGEDFFLYSPRTDGHTYGRDDLIPFPKSETILHSPVDIADKNYHSQFKQLDAGKWLLRGTRHFASYRYQKFKSFTGVACCVAALGMLRRLRARAWNEDTLDETLDVGYNFFRDSLGERGGPVRRLVLGELKETFKIRDKEYKHKDRGIVVWGKLLSSNPKVFDLCRGIEQFFKECDGGILQIPGHLETAIWSEGDKFYVYHPWPACQYGFWVGLQEAGKACLLYFTRLGHLCDWFIENVRHLKRKPFSISDVAVFELEERPEPFNKLKPVGPNRWIVRGHYHEGDERFPENHRNKQATPVAIAAIAMANVLDPETWTPEDVDEVLIRGDILYENTMENLEKLGISFDQPAVDANEEGGEDEEGMGPGPSGTLAAADVLPRFKVSDYDCIESDVLDSTYSGHLLPPPGDQSLSLKNSLKEMFKDNKAAVLTARGSSIAVWKHDGHYYMFDPHGCDENGLPTDEPKSAACLVRMKENVKELADMIMGNLPPGSDDSFNLSPVEITVAKLNPEIGAPETKLEARHFEWMNRGTAAILMGPRGENSAIGKAADKSSVPKDDLAGRTLALPAAAAFCAATESVPPPHMHQDHMYNFLDAGGEYYRNHVKKTGRKDIGVDDLGEKFEMGANTFQIELAEPIRLPLRLPDGPVGEGGEEEEEGGGDDLAGEGEEEVKAEPPLKQMKELLSKMWYDTTKSSYVSLLVGDYHQLGVWLAPGGKVVAFDAAPTLHRGLLTPQRIAKGDQLRLQRIKDEAPGEGGGDDEDVDEEDAGGEGEEKPEPEPEFVPPESCPALMVFSSPGEFIDKLVAKGSLDPKQAIAPYWLYPVTVKNELTSSLKEMKGAPRAGEGDEEEGGGEDLLTEALDDAALGKYFTRISRGVASLRGHLAQNEAYFMDPPNRDRQDAANAVMGIVVEHIEPYTHWKASLIDAILKYGDRLYTMSVPSAANPPHLTPDECQKEFHVTNFNVKLDIDGDVVTGDVKGADYGGVWGVKRALAKFFEANKYGVICSKGYCAAVWKASDDKAYCYWDPHPIGPRGLTSPGGAAGLILYASLDDVAEAYKNNVLALNKPGANKFSISSVKVFWEISKAPAAITPQGAIPDEGYEWKVLTAYVETARGRTILRGTRPLDLSKFAREAVLQSACSAIVAAAMSHVRRSHLWTHKTVDEIMLVACHLFTASIRGLGYEFRPGEDILLPLQVQKRFVLGVNYVRCDLETIHTGRLEQKEHAEMTCRSALEHFFDKNTHGILWSAPHAVAVWRVPGAPGYYMMEPHACGPTGLRIEAQDDCAACVLTFSSPKLLAYGFLQNYPVAERTKHEFQLHTIKITVTPIKRLSVDPPLVRAPPGAQVVPATSRVDMEGHQRRADEQERRHPPGSVTCVDAQRAAEAKDKADTKYKGQRNASGWLVLLDGTGYLSARHSMACRKFPYASRGCQALACSVMAVAMNKVEEVCRWCTSTLDQVLESGDQLYQDSYLHYRPGSGGVLRMDQILRKFYTPGNCVCRVVVYQPRQKGFVDKDLYDGLMQFFREERAGVFVAGRGEFAVALFRTPRGFYMFDPSDRDRYGRAVAPPCEGRARACLSTFPSVKFLAEKLGPNIPPVIEDDQTERPSSFIIYGVEVTSLRRLNQHEK